MGKKKDPVEDREDLRDDRPEIEDDLETADAKSGSVDERIPERYGDHIEHTPAAGPAAYVPQGGTVVPRGEEDIGPGEEVLAKERRHRTIPKRPG